MAFVPIIRAFINVAPLFDTQPYPQASIASPTSPRRLPTPVQLSPDKSLGWGKLSKQTPP
jgi:hypothetical protein